MASLYETTQGEEYEEDEYEEDEELEEEEEDEDSEAQVETLFGLPKNYVFIGGAIILVLIIAIIIFASRKKKQETYEYYDDTEYYDDSATLVINDEPVTEPEPEPEITDLNALLTDEDKKLLRKMGYTGDEIEIAISHNFSVDDLVKKAQKLHDEESRESLVRMSDAASEEFRYIVGNTYFSQVGQDFVSQIGIPVSQTVRSSGKYKVNADYTKCPTYGTQLYLKCRIAEDVYIWYAIDPHRWDQLPDKGNMVLIIDYSMYGPNFYVTGVKEDDDSLPTVNATMPDNTITYQMQQGIETPNPETPNDTLQEVPME